MTPLDLSHITDPRIDVDPQQVCDICRSNDITTWFDVAQFTIDIKGPVRSVTINSQRGFVTCQPCSLPLLHRSVNEMLAAGEIVIQRHLAEGIPAREATGLRRYLRRYYTLTLEHLAPFDENNPVALT